MRFTKMQAAGNDYVYMDTLKAPISSPEALARRISDRHFGVGSDGLILICPPSDPGEADFRMRMFNADGSEAEMCGNGIRCVGKYVYDNGHTDKGQVRIETLAGVLTLRLHVSGGKVETVTVDMGEPRLAPKDIPVSGPARISLTGLCGTGPRLGVTAVSMGNPHAVVFMHGIDNLDLSGIGPQFDIILVSPRTNTEFVEVVGRHVEDAGLGARRGRSIACGTGRASVVAAC
ncbi:MAG: diaminopimelate epimerase [Bilophila wadsworthia]